MGDRDPIIPVEHGREANAQMPGSRFEVFERSGHFPQLDDPDRFAALLSDFIASTDPVAFDRSQIRERVLGRGDAPGRGSTAA